MPLLPLPVVTKQLHTALSTDALHGLQFATGSGIHGHKEHEHVLPGACCCFSVLCVLAASACMLPVLSMPPPTYLSSDQQAQWPLHGISLLVIDGCMQGCAGPSCERSHALRAGLCAHVSWRLPGS